MGGVLLLYALQFVGKPYIWGGEGPAGFDCSGFIQELLKSIGGDQPGDQNAQMIYDHYKYAGEFNNRALGALAFYGKSATEISHVAMFLNDWQVIEAGGGDHETTNAAQAEVDHAFIRVRPFNHRKDLIGVYKPKII